jgi:hypothetical protein
MHTKKILAVIVVVTLFLGACRPKSVPTPYTIPNTGGQSDSIGKISAEETVVESGPIDKLIQITSTEDFFNHDTVRVTNGGVAKINFFVDQISIRLFNDTSVDDVKAEVSGTSNPYVRMKLVYGGLSGEVTKNGVPVQFELTNGVNIYVLGTQFLVLYDSESGTTYIGNFDGTIAYSLPGQPVQFTQAGQLYEVSRNFEIRQSTLNFTRTEIDNLTTSRRSTLLTSIQEYLAPTATPTSTTPPTSTATASATATPTPSPTFSRTPSLTPSPIPPPTRTMTATKLALCDQAAFVADVSVPDGTVFSPGFQFTKVWRLKNIGVCTWTTSYSLVFYRGDQMSGSTSVALPSTVAPGQTVDIPVSLVAPRLPGSYHSEWILKNPSGAQFGVGANAAGPIWINIRVADTSTITVTVMSTGTIAGVAFYDYNNNQTPDSGELAQALVVTLYDSTGTTMLASRETDGSGRYAFSNLNPGTYYVKWLENRCGVDVQQQAMINLSGGGTQAQNILIGMVIC